MHLIKLFIIGIVGYVLSGLYDVAILYRKQGLKRVLAIGFLITAVPYIILFFSYSSPLPFLSRIIIIFFLIIFALLLVYSVIIEIPLKSHKKAVSYKQGTYSISRHPGFLWYTVINILIAVYFWDIWIFVLCTGLVLCNLVLVIIEDVVLFPNMFEDYSEYKTQVSFLISLRNISHRRTKRW